MKHSFYFLKPSRQMSILQMMGIALLVIGLACIIGIGISTLASPAPTQPNHSSTSPEKQGSGPSTILPGTNKNNPNPAGQGERMLVVSPPTKEATIMALGFLLIAVAWPLIFPNMLRSSAKGEVSSTRTVVYMLVAVFITLAIRTGWTDPSMEGLILGSGWVSVLAVAFGAKTLQYFGENMPFLRSANVPPQINPVLRNVTQTGSTSPNSAPNLPPKGASIFATAVTPLSTEFIQSNAGDLPIHFHSAISNYPATTLPPAIAKAMNPSGTTANPSTKRHPRKQ
jgi:hypothetical protein